MEIEKQSIWLMNEVYLQNYYVPLFNHVLAQHSMSSVSIKNYEHSEDELVLMWNDFWWELPDSPSIRTPLFFEICNLCENDV